MHLEDITDQEHFQLWALEVCLYVMHITIIEIVKRDHTTFGRVARQWGEGNTQQRGFPVHLRSLVCKRGMSKHLRINPASQLKEAGRSSVGKAWGWVCLGKCLTWGQVTSQRGTTKSHPRMKTNSVARLDFRGVSFLGGDCTGDVPARTGRMVEAACQAMLNCPAGCSW